MAPKRSAFFLAPRRLRPAGPHCRGGASSLLRLTPPAAGRLPTAPALSDWMSHAASVLMPVTGPIAAFDMAFDAAANRPRKEAA